MIPVQYAISTVTRKLPVNSNGLHGDVDLQLSLYGLLLLTQPLHSLEQHTRADLEFSSDFAKTQRKRLPTSILEGLYSALCNNIQCIHSATQVNFC